MNEEHAMLNGIIEREGWEYLRSERSAEFRKQADQHFIEMFPGGHEYSIRSLVSGIGAVIQGGAYFRRESELGLMHDIHPGAFDLLVIHGRDYTPYIWENIPEEPKKNKCFYNARRFVIADRDNPRPEGSHLVYVEGISMNALTRPMHHAWNAPGIDSSIAVDITHYSICSWSRYLGIAFYEDEYRKLCDITTKGDGHSIFGKDYFNIKVKDRLLEIFEKRKMQVF